MYKATALVPRSDVSALHYETHTGTDHIVLCRAEGQLQASGPKVIWTTWQVCLVTCAECYAALDDVRQQFNFLDQSEESQTQAHLDSARQALAAKDEVIEVLRQRQHRYLSRLLTHRHAIDDVLKILDDVADTNETYLLH